MAAVNRGNSSFYDEDEERSKEGDLRFFAEMETLSNRQTLLFQRSCQQLRDIYGGSSNKSNNSSSKGRSAYNTLPTRLPGGVFSFSSKQLRPPPSPSRPDDPEAIAEEARKSHTFDRYYHYPSRRTSASTDISSSSSYHHPRPPPPRPPAPMTEVVCSPGAEELYAECLHCLLHQIGCDADRDRQFELVEHLRKAFG